MMASDSRFRRCLNSVSPTSAAHQLAGRLRGYFDRHPEVSREAFLVDALQREIDAREPKIRRGQAHRRYSGRYWWDGDRRPVTAEDIRIHAWLNRRLARLPRRRRRSFWPTLRRFLSRNPLTRWLVPRRR